jgi:hypothetical protein
MVVAWHPISKEFSAVGAMASMPYGFASNRFFCRFVCKFSAFGRSVLNQTLPILHLLLPELPYNDQKNANRRHLRGGNAGGCDERKTTG